MKENFHNFYKYTITNLTINFYLIVFTYLFAITHGMFINISHNNTNYQY
jgi:hypothetical protein